MRDVSQSMQVWIYAGQFAVDVGNGFLVFEILHGAYAAYYQTGIYLPGKVDSQAVIGLHNDARLVPVVVSYHLFALFQGEIRILIFIDADAYDDFVYKSQCTAHYRRVSDSKRVECSRKDSSSHDAKSSSITKLLIIKFCRSMVFLPM